jgi:hypothetical protein
MAVWIALGAVFISLMMMGVALYAANQKKKKDAQGGLPPM